jgi:hypothetical protein
MARYLDPRMIDPSKDVTYTGTYFVTPSGTSDLWNTISSLVQTNSANWEESSDITNLETFIQTNSALWEESSDITNLETFISTTSGSWGLDSEVRSLTSNWESTYIAVCSLSAQWEESTEILPTITNYLSTELVTVSSLNVTEQLLSANNDLFSLFLTPANTLTTSVCAMSGNGATPFTMQFTKGLLTSITF